MRKKTPDKLYYSITEVSELTEVKPHVLRYWETEFKALKPKKNRAGNRTYRSSDPLDPIGGRAHAVYQAFCQPSVNVASVSSCGPLRLR